MDSTEFRQKILVESQEDILNNILLSDACAHVSPENQNYIISSLATTYGVGADTVKLIIVGSAKLGFSISEKRTKEKFLPRYRVFGPDSDIDIAVICSPIYDMIWNELSRHSFEQLSIPWDSARLGDYLVGGWLRPDHFPRVRLRRCDDWWDTFNKLSAQQILGRRRVRGGLFNNIQQLKNYQSRALKDCINFEKYKI